MPDNDSLQDFLREAIQDHDAGASLSDARTVSVAERMRKSELGTLPGHEVCGFIARGGMGAVYLARQQALEREVAVKVMTSKADSPEMAERFRREALVLGRLAHPNIVPVYDVGTDDEGQLFYTMKLVKGRTLQHIINDLRAGDQEALMTHTLASLLTVFRKVCDALAFAHSQGIIHRDLKPENVMVGEFGEVLVMDWGLAKWRNDETRMTNDEVPEDVPSSSFVLRNSEFTLLGSVMGTPQYMSPEQAMGRVNELDARSDIFSLGGILYAILTLRPPVEGTTLQEVLDKVRSGHITSPSAFASTTGKGRKVEKKEVLEARKIIPLPHLSGGRVPTALSSVVMKALQLDKARRYPSVAEFSADIEAYQGGFATRAEAAGTLRQIKLLMLRHKAVTAALVVLLLTSIGFVLQVMASERKAELHALRADQNEAKTRRALGASQVSLAEAAHRSVDLPMMVQALDSVAEDLRDQRWEYLSAKRDASLGEFHVEGFKDLKAAIDVPGRDGEFVIADSAGLIGIVDVRTKAVLRRIPTNLKGNVRLALSPDGRRLAVTAQGAPEIHLYRMADGGLEKSITSPSRAVEWLVFSPDGTRLAVPGLYQTPAEAGKQQLTLLDLPDGKVRWKLQGPYSHAVFSPDGERLFAGNRAARSFDLLRVDNGEMIQRRPAFFFCMALSLDRQTLAMGCNDGEVMLLDAATGQETRRARLHSGKISCLAWTAGSHLITVGNEEGLENGRHVMRLWETKGFAPLGTFFCDKETLPAAQMVFHPGSGHLLTVGNQSLLWHLPVDIETARITSTAEAGWATGFVSDSFLLARNEYSLACYDVTDPRQPRALPLSGPYGYLTPAVFRPAQMTALAYRMGLPPYSVKLYQMGSQGLEEKGSLQIPEFANRCDWDPAGKRLLVVHLNSGASLLDTQTGATLLKLPQKFERAVFVGGGDQIAAVEVKTRQAAIAEDVLRLIDAKSGQTIRSSPCRLAIKELVASADHRLIAIGGDEQVLHVHDAATLEERFQFRAHDAEITALAFHPTRPVIATGGADFSVKLWDYETGRLRTQFLGFNGQPVMIAFSPNGRLLSVECQDNATRLFDLEKGQDSTAVESAPEQIRPPDTPLPLLPDDGGWADVLAQHSAVTILSSGSGWGMKDGLLICPNKGYAAVPLLRGLEGLSYQIRLKIQSSAQQEGLYLGFPVGDRMVGFNLDGWPFSGHYTGLSAVKGRATDVLPGALHGRQVQDFKPHDLELTIQLVGSEARISTRLDGRPLYEWKGPMLDLTESAGWRTQPGQFAIGTCSANWRVLEVKARRLK